MKLHKINGKNHQKNGLSSELFFLDCFKRNLTRSFLHLKALEISFSKLVSHAQKVHLLRELCPLKVYRIKTKIRVFSYGNNQIFIFHRQILRGHNSLERWTFWACNTSFEKLISSSLRCQRDLSPARSSPILLLLLTRFTPAVYPPLKKPFDHDFAIFPPLLEFFFVS